MARSRRSSGVVWNLLTVLILVGAVCVLSLFLMIFINPQSALNPFPPPTVPVLMVLPTSTPTSANQLPPTWTPTTVPPPTETPTPRATNTPTTPTVTATFYVLPSPTITPTPTATKPPEFLLSGGIQYDRAGPTTGRGCDWMGVGGNVVDLDGNPVQGLTVLLGGEYETKAVNKTTLTGTNLDYGEGGYEFTIANDPGPSKETLYVQLFTPDGKTVSAQYFFRTYDDCKQNLIRLDFQQSQ